MMNANKYSNEKGKPGWAQPIPKKTLSRYVTDKITEAMVNGDLKPGDFLPTENQLVEMLGVGKSSVREATKMLEAVGAVEIIKGRGCRIRDEVDMDALSPLTYQLILQHSTAGYEDLILFRYLTEEAANLLAMDEITPQEMQALEEHHAKMEQNYRRGINNLELDIQFHKMIYSAAHNPYLACVGSAVMQLLRPSLAISNAEHADVVIRNHSVIIDAFRRKDRERMKEAIASELKDWKSLSLG